MSGTRSLPPKRSSLSQKSQLSLSKPKFATNNNQPNKYLKSTNVKTKPLKKSSSSISINPNTKVKIGDIEQTNPNELINNNNNNSQNEINANSQSIESNDNTVQQIKPRFPPGVTVDEAGKTPISPTLAKQNYRRMLTAYEMTEINNYPEIYYIGKSISKKNAKEDFDQYQTFQYQAISGDHIAYRYEILSFIHTGTFSTIFKCTDHKSKEKVAIKIYVNTPEIHQKKQAEVENMKIISSNDSSIDMTPSEQLQRLSSDANTSNRNIKHFVKLIDGFVFRNQICIVMELLGESLADFMKQKPSQKPTKEEQKNSPFSPLMVKLIAYQIMDGLADIHRKKIIHGDLRPQNILFTNFQQEESSKAKAKSVKNDKKTTQKEKNDQQNLSPHFTFSFTEVDNITLMSKVKIVDFGSSCKQTEIVSNHFLNRFYRAPEVVLGSSFGTAIDVWSAGCIIIELLTGKPLFPAVNDTDLLAKFIETLGQPPATVVEMKSDFQPKSPQGKAAKKLQPTKNKFFDKDGSLLNLAMQPVPFKNRLTSILKTSDTMMIDFLSKCLEWDKSKRLSAAKLAKHPWIAALAKQNI